MGLRGVSMPERMDIGRLAAQGTDRFTRSGSSPLSGAEKDAPETSEEKEKPDLPSRGTPETDTTDFSDEVSSREPQGSQKKSTGNEDGPGSGTSKAGDGRSHFQGKMESLLNEQLNSFFSDAKVAFTPTVKEHDFIKSGDTIGSISTEKADLLGLKETAEQLGISIDSFEADQMFTSMRNDARQSIEDTIGEPVDMSSERVCVKSSFNAGSVEQMQFGISSDDQARVARGMEGSSGGSQGPGAASPAGGGNGSNAGTGVSKEKSPSPQGANENTENSPSRGSGQNTDSTAKGKSQAKKEKALHELQSDPEKILREGGLSGDEAGQSPAEGDEDSGQDKSTFLPFDVKVGYTPDQGIKEGDYVKTGDKLAQIDVDSRELDDNTVKQALKGVLKKCVGENAEVDGDGAVRASSSKKIEFIASGERLTEERELIKNKDLEREVSFDTFMENQQGDGGKKTQEFAEQNTGRADSGWAKNLLAKLHEEGSGPSRNGKEAAPGLPPESS
ncbi:MAG: hypothetical protein RDV48_31100 [Candidatus Eremiobacteraeota bacterium]|nr:hypothetical protein [Candidatus Eremiobacteraeota bacterium]